MQWGFPKHSKSRVRPEFGRIGALEPWDTRFWCRKNPGTPVLVPEKPWNTNFGAGKALGHLFGAGKTLGHQVGAHLDSNPYPPSRLCTRPLGYRATVRIAPLETLGFQGTKGCPNYHFLRDGLDFWVHGLGFQVVSPGLYHHFPPFSSGVSHPHGHVKGRCWGSAPDQNFENFARNPKSQNSSK